MPTRFLFLLLLFSITASKYFVINDITKDSIASQWIDQVQNQQLQLCSNYQSEISVGQQSSVGQIYWKRIYSLPKTTRIYVYMEYQISGSWNNDEIQIFSNGIKIYSEKIKFSDTNKQCNQKFLYESYIYFNSKTTLNTLTLELMVSNINLGLYIKNIVLTQQQLIGRNELLKFEDSIANCNFSGSMYGQYYCQCDQTLVFQNTQCKGSCDQNFLYSSTENTCIQQQHCSSCSGLVENLVCDVGYYFYTDPIYGDTYCLSQCPLSHYQDETLKVCSIMEDYLSPNENGGYPVLHTYFYINIHNFLHHFESNEFYLSVESIPTKVNERGFFYRDGSFHIGSWDTFQSQTLIISQNIKSSQYKLRFRAKAYFIDFYPKTLNFYINDVLQQAVTLQINPNNQKDLSKFDYYAQFDFYWVRTELYPVVMNTFMFEIEQPLQSGNYVGYFYLDELNVFQYQCQTGCNACFTYKYCNPCLNPANKNPSDCSCLSGYAIKDDICISCPTYCTTCDVVDICVDCKPSTLRINSPVCDTCPSNYYVKANTENCQPCITGCKVCSNNTSCTQCQSGYFRNSSNVCVILCPDGQFNDSSNINDPKCTICDNNCLTCQNLATTCTGCKGLATLVSGHCYLCNDGQYLSGTTCIPCIQDCQTCSNVTCGLCSEQYFLNSVTNQCITTCDDGYFGNSITRTCDSCISSCLTCLGGTNQDCLTCPPGKFLNIQNVLSGECSSNCLVGQYKLDGLCPKCWKGCYSCLDDTSECLVCATKYFRLKSDNKCYDKCPDGYYNNIQGNVCSPCDLSCYTCDGFSEKNCLSCNPPLAFYRNQCLTACYPGYGNISNVCLQCAPNCKSCFGTQINQCLSCNYGFYYLNNQCFIRCPKSFVGIRPQYVCKCIYDNCVTCTATQYFLNNACYVICPSGYFGYNGLCVQCHIICATCFGEYVNQCMTCNSGLIFYENKCIPNCLGNLYHDIPTNECKVCDLSCLLCTGPNVNDCTACPYRKLLTQNGTCQDTCSNGEYAVASQQKCYLCHPSCVTCFGQSNKNCLACPQGQYNYLYECVATCPDGFLISSNGVTCNPNTAIVIAQCAYQCDTCMLTPRFCKKCAANRSANAPSCYCENGYFDNGVSSLCPPCANKCSTCFGVATNCLTCKGDRLLPFCECPQYSYDDGESVNCTKCQDNCETCDLNGCITCLADRLNPPDCICRNGYFEAYQYFCQECSQRCKTCSGTALLCLTCSGLREKPPICGCPSGYFENSETECQQCPPACVDCNINGCLSCFGNRVGPEFGQCQCDINGISRFSIGQIYCTDCQLGVPYFALNQDFTGFSFEFGGEVTISKSIKGDLCTAFFEPSTLAKLGTNPQCNIDFSIIFGENPTIQVDDLIYLNNVFTLDGCNSPFTSILPLPLKIPPNIDIQTHLPNVKFKEIQQFNVCEELTIEFDKLYFNGRQKFNIIQWFQALPINQKPEIQAVLQAATIAQNDSLIFPIQAFDFGILYKISVKIQSFAKLQNTVSIHIQGTDKSTLKFYSKSENNYFHRFENITIPFQIAYYNCYQLIEEEQTLFFEIILKNENKQILSQNQTLGIANGFKYDISINFKPFFFEFQNPYFLILNANISNADDSVKTQNIFDIFIIPTQPILSIEGGNRMVGFSDDLHLNSLITDPDLTKAESIMVRKTCVWTCLDIVDGSSCLTQNNQTITFNSNCNQTIPGKSFAPYKVFIFGFSIVKEQVPYSANISIQFIELDLPLLTVIGPNQDQLHNYYDEFIYKVIYPGINPDVLMYAGAIIYDQITQATFQFYYLEFKFKIENYFTNFDVKNGNTAKMRLSVYDPRFILPSLNTVTLKMNIPPQNCRLKYQTQENYIEFFDFLRISVEDCEDENTPLLYSVLLFPNSSIYQRDLEQSNFYNYQLLVPPQEKNNFSLTLPFYNKQDMLLVFKIKDSFEGIVNITKSISVKQYLNISEQDLRNYQVSLENNFDYILIGYDLITQRLKQIQHLNDYKIKLLFELINMDQNYTMLSNQTETLYRCISNILSQNVSLIEYNETLILQQLNYIIQLSQEQLIYYTDLQRKNQLTSLQNIDKSNYVKQYYTFTHILSSYINYRVGKNVTATEIQDQLSQMINYLQDISVANEPMFKIQSNSVDMNFSLLTTKMVNEIAGATIKEDSYQVLRLLQSESGQQSSGNQKKTTNFYKFSQTRFLDNPFYATKGFPKNSSGYQAVDPKMINLNSSSSSSNLSSPMKFKFPVNKTMANNTIPKCVTKVSDEDWNADVCKTKNKNGEVICECESLNPTSIMESLDFIADKAEQVFSLDTLSAFGSFPFYKTFIFYFYILITGVYLYIVYWGIRVDNAMFTKVYAEQDLLEQQKKLEEQTLKEQEQLGRIVKEEKEEISQKENVTDNNQITSLKQLEEIKKEDEILTLPALQRTNIFNNKNSYDQIIFENRLSFNDIQSSDKIPQSQEILNENEKSQFKLNKININTQVNTTKIQKKNSESLEEQRYQNEISQQNEVHRRQKKSLIEKSIGLKEQLIRNAVTNFKAYIEYLKFFHQILSIVYKSDQKKPRGLRASIVYTSILGSLAVLFVFNQPNNLSFTLALALITAPANKIYQIILEKMLSHKKKTVRSGGAFFMICSAGLISYVMLAGLVMMDSVGTANQWSYIFIGTFTLDNLLYNPIQLMVQYLIHMEFIKLPILQIIFDKMLDEKAKEFLYGLIEEIHAQE